MQFLYPSFLWAMFAIGIPILIHLFYFRRFKNVYFSNIEFLKEIKEETSSRNKLKNLLILLARILAVAALVFAFAQPIIPPPGDKIDKGNNVVSIYIDNSFSMSAYGEDISLLDKSKLDAIQIVKAYSNEDQFQVLTNELRMSQQSLLSQEEAIEQLELTETTHMVSTLGTIMNRQLETIRLSVGSNGIIYWLSDFQKSIVDIDRLQLDSLIEYNAILAKSVQEKNISIDSCWWIAPIPVLGQKSSLIVKLSNHDEQDAENIAVNLIYGQQNFPLGKVNIAGNKSIFDTIQLSLNQTGWNEASLEISDYPVVFDDKYWIAFDVAQQIQVLMLGENSVSKYTRAVFETSSIFQPEFKRLDEIDYTGLARYKLIVLEDVGAISTGLASVLKNYIENGGNVLLFPSVDATIESLNVALNSFGANNILSKEIRSIEAGYINEDEFIFSDVFDNKRRKNIELPKVEQRYLMTDYHNRKARRIIGFKDGKSFVDAYTLAKGNFYFSTVPLDISVNNLAKRAELFVPMLYKMSLSSNLSERLAYTIGKDNSLSISRQIEHSEIPYKITGEDEFIPAMRNLGSIVQLGVGEQLKKAGIYAISHKEELIKKVAFNYDRKESDLSCISEDELIELIGDRGHVFTKTESSGQLKDIIIEREKGTILWKWFIILALVFLGVEILLLRLFKN